MQIGSQEFTVGFKVCDRQLDLLEVSLVYDKSDKHLTFTTAIMSSAQYKKLKALSQQIFQKRIV